MATLQEQIDDLRRQLAVLQDDISKRAKFTDVNTINIGLSSEQLILDAKLVALEGCLGELLGDLIDAREELSSHSH